MASISQQAEKLFQLNRNFEAEIEEAWSYSRDAGSNCVLQILTAKPPPESAVQLMNTIVDSLLDASSQWSHKIGEGLTYKVKFQDLVDNAKQLVHVLNYDLLQLKSILLKKIKGFTLEDIWLLHQSAVLLIRDVLSKVNAKDCMIAGVIRTCSRMSETHWICAAVIPGVVGELLLLAYCSTGGNLKDTSAVAKDCLIQCVEGVYSCPASGTEREGGCSCPSEECCDLFDIISEVTDVDTRQSFFSDLLKIIFSKSSGDSLVLLAQQEHLTFSHQPHGRRRLLSQVAQLLSVDANFDILRHHLALPHAPLKGVLMFASCLLHSAPRSQDRMSDFCRTEIKVAFDQSNKTVLSNALMLVRQCSLEGSHVFPAYSNWFQTNLGGGRESLVVANSHLVLLLDVLRVFVPHDSSSALKMQYMCLARAFPESSQHVLQYKQELRRRLDQLNERVEDMTSPPIITEDPQVISDVEQAVKEFQNKQHIPNFVAEASLFKKPYFGHFLQHLLFCELDSSLAPVKEGLIVELERAKKIPQKLWEKFQKIKNSIHVGKDDLLSAEVEQNTKDIFKQITDTVRRGKKKDVQALISKLSLTLPNTESVKEKDHWVTVNLSSPGLLQWELQLTDVILESICECVIKTTGESTAGCDLSYWLGRLVDMIHGKKLLHVALFVRLWDLIANKMADLSLSHTVGLSAVFAHLSLNRREWTELLIQGRYSRRWNWEWKLEHLKTGEDYCAFIIGSMCASSDAAMLNALRFLYHYVQYRPSKDEVMRSPLHSVVSQMFRYLTERYMFAGKYDSALPVEEEPSVKKRRKLEEHTLVDSCSAILSKHSNTLLPFSVWLEMELQIPSLDSALSGHLRSEYLITMVTNTYLSSEVSAGGFGGSSKNLFKESFLAMTELHSELYPPPDLHSGIMLLQSIAHLMVGEVNTVSSADSRPVLLECMLAALEKKASKSVSDGPKAHLLKVILRLCSCLPPHLLLVDSIHFPVAPASLQLLTQLLSSNEFCLLHVNRLLPVDVVQLVVKSFVTILRLTEDQDTVSAKFQDFLHLCPLFLASLTKLTAHPFESEITKMIGEMSHDLKAYKKPLVAPLDFFRNDQSVMIALTVMFQNVNSEETSTTIQNFENFIQRIQDPIVKKKIALTAVDLILSHFRSEVLTWKWKCKPPPIAQILKHSLQISPEAALAFEPNARTLDRPSVGDPEVVEYLRSFRKHFPLAKSRAYLNPVLFYWILRNLPESFSINLCKNAIFASVAMEMYLQYLSLQSNSQYLDAAHELPEPHDPFSVESLQQVHRLLLRVLPENSSTMKKLQVHVAT